MTLFEAMDWCTARGWTIVEADDLDDVILVDAYGSGAAEIEVSIDDAGVCIEQRVGAVDGEAWAQATGHGTTLDAAWADVVAGWAELARAMVDP